MRWGHEASAIPKAVPMPDTPGPLGEFADCAEFIVVSNRGPIEYHFDGYEGVNYVRGAGGVAAALSCITAITPITWVFSAMTDGDRHVAANGHDIPDNGKKRNGVLHHNLDPHFVLMPPQVYHKYYEEFSNRVLWFLQHYMWNSPYEPSIGPSDYDAWKNGYVVANRLFAEKVTEVISHNKAMPIFLLQDFHLYLTPRLIRQRVPECIIQHFTHIPWPEPRYWELLPPGMREDIYRSLVEADILGFQTRQDAQNFLDSCQAFLKDARVDRSEDGVGIKGHMAHVRVYPISVDPVQLRRRLRSARVQAYVEELRPFCGEKTIVRVDRLEPSKNIIRGLQAFDSLLATSPELVGKVKLVQFLVPSRDGVPEYRRYRKEVMKLIASINDRYGRDGWKPLEVFYENNYDRALAGLMLYDVLFVNPLIDGMNLVAKEGPIVNRKNGVLVLSEGAGAYHQLREGVVAVAAADVDGSCRALRTALTMSLREKRRRAQILRRAIETEDIHRWFENQLTDIASILKRSSPRYLVMSSSNR
ncbi:MAG: trehalose-6-phosphate synthase [Chloroflexi bacterium]|nr:trehalose-6-phosphate synthase [Chloroflexota bacterium]MDA8186600.1 trehalose-6-phosphate synthase [Dehalococcoidales bacterium]